MVGRKYKNTSALFSDGALSTLRLILESEFPGRVITGSDIVEAAIKITSFVAIHQLTKECHE